MKHTGRFWSAGGNMSEGPFFEPAHEVDVEITIKRSRFIAAVRKAHSEDEARERISEASHIWHNASHNCWAFRAGQAEACSDAGEPSGTAGRPILGAIKRSGLTHVAVIVSRYFGGVKLGVRGLIEAYGGCATLALERAGKAPWVPSEKACISIPYERRNALLADLKTLGVKEEDISAEYGESVKLVVPVPIGLVNEAEAMFKAYKRRFWIEGWEWLKERG